ncbi:DNA-damage-inducible protein D [Clostridium putrefaciens]|uniref:DNA-damage-inducible protein D n=2 Tax=Clostridium putrefaciens TaxID=99675 RepID=A0A381J7A2_9CLOT|nr:DNA-damage-inducible protein D [Clostridium putrefaciens]
MATVAMVDIEQYNEKTFEKIKNINEFGQEFWYARELVDILEYTKWGNFKKVIDKAKEACNNSDINVSDHFADVGKMVGLGSGSEREIEDIMLSRYACYLIVQNADSRKKVVALGQTYFAVQTRKQELIDNFEKESEDKKRLAIRNELVDHNKSLAEAAQMAGIEDPRDYAVFQNRGYQGLYGGLGAKEIKERKGLKKSHKILDYMGSTELAANLFRATQTDEKLRRENIKGKYKANEVHYKVGVKVRKTIEELGGTMPEDLPTPKKSVKAIEKEEQNKLKNGGEHLE